MPTRIKFIINYINDLLLFESNSNIVIIEKKITSNGIEYKEYININWEIPNSLYKKEYFIDTNYYDIYSQPLNKLNFVFELNSNKKIIYDYDYNNQVIYFYYELIQIPFNMIGLINSNKNIGVLVKCNLKTIFNTTEPYLSVVNLKNNNLLDSNTIILPGSILSISSIEILSTYIVGFNYYLFKTVEPIVIRDIVKIYFYDPTYIRIINIPISDYNYRIKDSINFLVQLIGNSGSILYSYIVNLNLDLVKSETSTSFVIAFKNYVNENIPQTLNYEFLVLRVFDYDYYKYFSDLVPGDFIQCVQISLDKANLYAELIETNIQIPNSIILNLNPLDFSTFIDINSLDRIFTINQNLSNSIVDKLLYSKEERFNIILDYLINFKIKSYNFFNINFIPKQYDGNKIINQIDNKTRSDEIAFENQMLNAILTNIEIFYQNLNTQVQNFNIYGMLFNNNNTWDIYTKKYLLDPTNKYNLIKDLLIMAINYIQIQIYTYSDLNDLSNVKINPISNTGFIYINSYWRYNRLILNRSNSSLVFDLDQNYYLKMYLNVKLNYIMLIFSSNSLITSSPDSLVLSFRTEGLYGFKLYRIQNPNGSTQLDQYVYSILFQNIEECNNFIYYIKEGIATRLEGSSLTQTSSYFNFIQSKFFKQDSTGYYILSNESTGAISFQIINLNLYSGNVFINNKIILN